LPQDQSQNEIVQDNHGSGGVTDKQAATIFFESDITAIEVFFKFVMRLTVCYIHPSIRRIIYAF
jgi:hypothetical protein